MNKHHFTSYSTNETQDFVLYLALELQGGAARTKFINPPPDIAPTFFQDRAVETELIATFLRDEAQRLLTINGRAGIGKTAMICRLLKALENGHLPDDLGPLSVDGIVYLSATGSRRINVPNLFAALSSDISTCISPAWCPFDTSAGCDRGSGMRGMRDNCWSNRHASTQDTSEYLPR